MTGLEPMTFRTLGGHSIHLATTLRTAKSFVAQWIERPPGVWKVVGSNLIMGSEFFLSIIGL